MVGTGLTWRIRGIRAEHGVHNVADGAGVIAFVFELDIGDGEDVSGRPIDVGAVETPLVSNRRVVAAAVNCEHDVGSVRQIGGLGIWFDVNGTSHRVLDDTRKHADCQSGVAALNRAG